MEELDDRIEKLIAEIGNEDLMNLWLERLSFKKEQSERIEKRLSEKDPILTGALIGAAIGSLFNK